MAFRTNRRLFINPRYYAGKRLFMNGWNYSKSFARMIKQIDAGPSIGPMDADAFMADLIKRLKRDGFEVD